ncbi:MAG: hypothetical protein HY909_24985 [Deltaproteobacteria bacterium]|nr:hypothetical protein [Deltaproteobacteria bacterium]
MKLVVLGGGGYLGARAVKALQGLPGVEVKVAGRSARGPDGVQVDLTRPETFGALDGVDLVLDVADATRAPPDALARHCLERGVTFVEASSDRAVVERLHDTLKDVPSPKGAVVLGAGIFTGLSNLLAAEAARRAGNARRVVWAARTTPFAGAGESTVKLMTDTLRVPTVRYEAGQRVTGPTVLRGPALPFPSGVFPTLESAMAEGPMLHHSLGVDTRVYLSPYPRVLQTMFLAMPAWLLGSGVFLWFLGVYFSLLRRVLLAGRPSDTELVARAEGDRVVTLGLRVDDGMRAGGEALAALGLLLAEHPPRGRAVYFIDQCVTLDEAVARMHALPGAPSKVTVKELEA